MTERKPGMTYQPVGRLWSVPGVCAADVCQSGPPAIRGLQQVTAAVDVYPDALWWEVSMLCGRGGQV